jgi:hypothetical protein
MSERQKRSLTILLALLAVFAVAGVAATMSDTEFTDSVAPCDGVISNEGTRDGSDTESGGDVLTAEEEDVAIDIAGAYFVAQTDFTRDQFDWKVEAAAHDNDGQWWARVSATPKDDTTSILPLGRFSPYLCNRLQRI